METKRVKVEIPPKGWDEYWENCNIGVKAFYSKESIMFGKALWDAIAEWESMMRDQEKGGPL